MSWLLPQLRAGTARLGACRHNLPALYNGFDAVSRALPSELLSDGQVACMACGHQRMGFASDGSQAGKPAETAEEGD